MSGRLTSVLCVIASGLMVLAGCQVSAEVSPSLGVSANAKVRPFGGSPGGTASIAPESATAEVPGGGREPVLFGDRPDFEDVPFENRLVSNLTQHSFTTVGLDFDPDVLPAEDLMVYASTRHAERPDIYMKKVDGTALTQITGDPADDIQPRFSPDGHKIAFASNRAGGWDIWVVDRDGTGLTQLTGDGADEIAPSWSPDGKQIAYSLWGERSRSWEIWVLSADQPGTRRFLAYGMFPAWSPDGKRIAFQRARQRGERKFSVWTIDLVEGGEARHPTEVAYSDAAACIAPSWSPDGRMLVYCVVAEGNRHETTDDSTPPSADLWVVDLPTGMRMKLTNGADAMFNPRWADRRIFFVSPRSGTENVWSLTARLAEASLVARGGAGAGHSDVSSSR